MNSHQLMISQFISTQRKEIDMNINEYEEYKKWCNECGLKPSWYKVLKMYLLLRKIRNE